MLALLLFLSSAHANVDETVRDSLRWENQKLPAVISDYGVTAMQLGSLTYTALYQDQHRWERTGAVAGALVVNFGANQLVKWLANRERPDASNRASFYSGHTSSSFTAAGAVCLQNGKAPCGIALGLAAFVGYLRIAADKHWLSDVIAGAGVGFAMGRLVPTVFVKF